MYINLTIRYLHKFKRPYLLIRVGGKYEQHAHFYTLEDALKVKQYIISNKYPKCDKESVNAIKRILTKKELNRLKNKQKYVNRSRR